MRQSLVAHLGRVQVEILEVGQGLEVDEAGVTHLGVLQVQPAQGGKAFQVNHAGIGHLGAAQMQIGHVLQAIQVDEAGVGQFVASEVKIDFPSLGVLSQTAHGPTQFLDRSQSLFFTSRDRKSR